VIAEQLGLPFGGQANVAGSMNIVFKADLSALVAHRPSVLYWIMSPGARMGGIGMGLVRMVRPWYEWLIVWGYDIDGPAPEVDVARATEIAHKLIGTDEIDVEIVSTSLWTNNKLWAERYSEGRVFCMGDAVHRHPPSNGLGSNTSVADAYNIAWKLAHVLRGHADPSLLRTYDDERVPVGEQIVKRANKSIEEFGPIFEALGLLDATDDPAQMERNMAARTQNTPAAKEQRAKLRAAIELKNYEFNAHGVELGQRYRSAAVVRPTARPNRPTIATPSSTTTPPPGRAPACRTAGSSTTGGASARSTSPARGASRC
jgi:2,4-dichlorophenol 6-monooxygenase